MKLTQLKAMTVDQLMRRFIDICIEQDRAELAGDTHRFRPLFDRMIVIEEELRARAGDQRKALLRVLDHPNMEVRLNAAKATLTAAPTAARKALETIWESQQHPQAAEAGMTIEALNEGSYKPT